MKILDIDQITQGTFFRCLHDERPDNPDVIRQRQNWFECFKPKGLRAKVLLDEGGDVTDASLPPTL